MTTLQREQLSVALERAGWAKDRWGYYTKEGVNSDGTKRMRRINMKERVVSIEVRGVDRWIRIYSTSWKNVKLLEQGVRIGSFSAKYKDV